MNESINAWLHDPVVGKLVSLFAGIAIIWGLVFFIRSKLINRIKDSSKRYHSRKAMAFFGYLLTLLFLLFLFSNKLNNLSVALGVAGAGIAFALQEVIASVAGWLALLFGNFYRVGDRVQLGGIKGDVIDIGVLRTTVMEIGQWVEGDLYNGRIVRIANSFVFKEPVFNYSADFPFLWDEIKLAVQTSSDYSYVQETLLSVAKEIIGPYAEAAKNTWSIVVGKYMIEDASTDPMISVVISNTSVDFTLRYVVNYKFRRSIKNAIFLRLLSIAQQSPGKIKLVNTAGPLKVEINKDNIPPPKT